MVRTLRLKNNTRAHELTRRFQTEEAGIPGAFFAQPHQGDLFTQTVAYFHQQWPRRDGNPFMELWFSDLDELAMFPHHRLPTPDDSGDEGSHTFTGPRPATSTPPVTGYSARVGGASGNVNRENTGADSDSSKETSVDRSETIKETFRTKRSSLGTAPVRSNLASSTNEDSTDDKAAHSGDDSKLPTKYHCS